MKLTQKDLTIEKHPVSNAWIVSCIHHGQLKKHIYAGYTKREVIQQFLSYVNQPITR